MNLIYFLIIALAALLTACSSPEIRHAENVAIETKGGFAVERHEPPSMILDNPTSTLDNVQIFTRRITFDSNSAKITKDSRKILNGLMGMMQMEPAYQIHIVGLADETEKNPKGLSMRRALSVAQLLRAAGVDESRIRINGQGRDLNLHCLNVKAAKERAACMCEERSVILTNKD